MIKEPDPISIETNLIPHTGCASCGARGDVKLFSFQTVAHSNGAQLIPYCEGCAKKVGQFLQNAWYNEWFYWMKNKWGYFVRFRDPEDKIASGFIRQKEPSLFTWKVQGPCWSTYEKEGVASTLDTAKAAVSVCILYLISQEFREEQQ